MNKRGQPCDRAAEGNEGAQLDREEAYSSHASLLQRLSSLIANSFSRVGVTETSRTARGLQVALPPFPANSHFLDRQAARYDAGPQGDNGEPC